MKHNSAATAFFDVRNYTIRVGLIKATNPTAWSIVNGAVRVPVYDSAIRSVVQAAALRIIREIREGGHRHEA